MRIALLPVLLAAAAGLGLESLNTPESEVSLTFPATLDEVWLERRSGRWGATGGRSRLLHARRTASTVWSAPKPVPFGAADASEGDAFFDASNEILYFVSDRPHPDLADSAGNIWRARRTADGWRAPEALPAPVNGPGNEYSPVRRGDRLYFASDRSGNGDLYVAVERTDGWTVAPLGPALNSGTGEWNLWVSPEEDLVLFEASERATNVAPPGDLYASVKDEDDAWLPAVALAPLNGPGSELNARMIGDWLVYASTSEHRSHADFHASRLDPREHVLAAYRHRLHVVNRSSHDLVSVRLGAGDVAERLPIGPGPHLVAAISGRLAVAAYGIFPRPHAEPVSQMPGWIEEPGGALLIVDSTGSAPAIQREHVPCHRPHGTVWSSDGQRLWVTCEDRGGVVELSPTAEDPGHRFMATGHSGAHVVAFDSDRAQLLVAHTEAGGIAFVNTASAASTAPIEPEFLAVGAGSEALWIDAARARAWVTLGPSNELAIVDLDDRSVYARVDPGCAFPIDIAAASDGLLWIACFGSSELVGIDPEHHEVKQRIGLPAGPLNVVAHLTVPVLYASLPRQNRVVEVSIPGAGVTRSFATGIEPDGLALVAD